MLQHVATHTATRRDLPIYSKDLPIYVFVHLWFHAHKCLYASGKSLFFLYVLCYQHIYVFLHVWFHAYMCLYTSSKSPIFPYVLCYQHVYMSAHIWFHAYMWLRICLNANCNSVVSESRFGSGWTMCVCFYEVCVVCVCVSVLMCAFEHVCMRVCQNYSHS